MPENPRSKGLPNPTIPTGDPAGTHAANLREAAGCDELVVVDTEREHAPIRPACKRSPIRSVPDSKVAHGILASPVESSPGDELAAENGKGIHVDMLISVTIRRTAEPRSHRMPRLSVPSSGAADRIFTRHVEGTYRNQIAVEFDEVGDGCIASVEISEAGAHRVPGSPIVSAQLTPS